MSEHGLSDVTVRKDLKGLSIRWFLTTQFKDGYTLEYIVSDGLLEHLVVSCEQKLPHNQIVWCFFLVVTRTDYRQIKILRIFQINLGCVLILG